MNGWLIAFYIFALLDIILVFGIIHALAHPGFRNEDGDLTTEVGFEEDPIGRDRSDTGFPGQDKIEDPHVAIEKFTQ